MLSNADIEKIIKDNSHNYIDIYNGHTWLMHIEWDNEKNTITSEFKSDPHIKIPLSLYPDRITWNNLMDWFETRTFPRTRIGVEELLRFYNLKEYNAYAICKQTHALSMSDYIWVRFNGEDIRYDDIKIRE